MNCTMLLLLEVELAVGLADTILCLEFRNNIFEIKKVLPLQNG